ncbi:MAG: extracellular solute-binding protein [Chloroflexi bacterium]|nr:extracellular solute-binding protein [Chloroflexota bacterium]
MRHLCSRRTLLIALAGTILPGSLAACAGNATATGAPGTTAAAKTTSTRQKAVPTRGVSAAPKPTPTPVSGETHKGASITVDLWYGWAGANAIHTWKALGAQMGKDLSSFNVHWITADNNTKLLTAIAAGTPPNVAVGNAPYPEFWARGAAQPLDDLIAKGKVIDRKDVPAASWSYASYKGKTYGVPEVEAFVRYSLTIDATNLSETGINPSTISWDWDTLTQLQQQLTKKASNGSISVLGIDPLDAMGGAFGGGNPFYWGQAWGIQYFDEHSGAFNFDNGQLAEAMLTVKKIYDIAGGARAVTGFHSSYGYWTGNPTAAMPSGVEDMQINGYWNPGDLALTSPHRSFVYTWPAVPTSHKGFKFQSTGGHSGFIPRGAKNSEEAFQVIEFLYGDTAEGIIFDSTGWLGARTSYLQKVDAKRYKGLEWFLNSAQHNDQLNGIPSNPIESFTATQWQTALQNVLYGRAQPKDALKQLQQVVTNEYKQRASTS